MPFPKKLVVAFIVLLTLPTLVLAHSGGTDKYGGHNNRKTGGYHYHNAGRAHAANNPHQNHKTCGICSTSKSTTQNPSSGSSASTILTDKVKVTFFQSALVILGYEVGTIDGVVGPSTQKALEEFQRGAQLKRSGKLDRSTVSALQRRMCALEF
jgi:hypothetical protein